MTDYFYITTPIYYVNDAPHIGHAYTTVACDAVARFMRLAGREVKFLTGTDEHGQKVDKAAKAKGIDTQAFTDEISQRFRHLVHDPLKQDGGDNTLNVSNTDFIRTTEVRHKEAATALWERLVERGHIYKDSYAGWYSVRDEAYYQPAELIEKDGKKLAPTGAEVEWLEEESYFFRLSAFEEKLLKLYEEQPGFVVPSSRLNEVRSFVKGGLKDLSISRTSFDWGVKVPGDAKHVMYVWIDALTNYLTSTGFPDTNAQEYKDFWAGGGDSPVHVVGKDILRFHAVYWPAFLMAAELPLPRRIVAHGWWTIEGEKMSKSLGNVLSPADMIARAGGIDQLRYYLLRAMPFGNDGDFSQDLLVETVNADLANNIGNLAQRTLTMIQKNCDAALPALEGLNEADRALLDSAQGLPERMLKTLLTQYDFHAALRHLVQLSNAANEYINDQAPWVLRKTDPARMGVVLRVLAEVLSVIGVALQPFCPNAAASLLDSLSLPEDARRFGAVKKLPVLHDGAAMPAPKPLFPRLEARTEAA